MKITDSNDNYIIFFKRTNEGIDYIDITDIYVKPENRNKGFGSELLKYLFKMYEDRHILCVVDYNINNIDDKISLINFFKRNKFEIYCSCIKNYDILKNINCSKKFKKILLIIEKV